MKNTFLSNYKNKDAALPLSKIFLVLLMYLLFFQQVYSYNGMPYVAQFKGSFVYEQRAISNTITIAISMAVVFFVLFLFFNTKFHTNGTYLVLCVILLFGVCMWSFWAIKEEGFNYMVYTSTPPWVYLTALMFCIGLNESMFGLFLKHAKILGVLSVIMCLITTISFFASHDGSVLADSSNLRYYIQGFWLLCVCSFFEEKNQNTFYYICISFFAIISFAFSSRSWLVQSIVWLFAYTLSLQKKKSIRKFLKTTIIAAILIGIIYFIIQRYLPNLLEILLEKTNPKDTRLHQYIDLFAQTDIWDYIVGNGYGFTYISSIQGGEYGYIDNAYLQILVRYGLMIGLTYPLIFFIPVLKSKLSKHTIPLIMWLMALGGLSIFCGIIIDLKCIALPVVAGRCMYLASKNKINQKETANNE